MNWRGFRNDASFLINGALLLAATAAAVTGWVSDRWDLNDFVYHRYAGYALAALAALHVALYWRLFVAYGRWRLGKRSRPRAATGAQHHDVSARSFPRLWASRRGFLGLLVGGLGGFVLGRGLRRQPALAYGSDIGEVYHEWSKPQWLSLLGTVADWGRQPPLYKEYTDVQRIALPGSGPFRGLYTEEAILKRRSVREYSDQPMALEELSRLLHYGGGITAERWGNRLRAAPSAGALYPIEVYPVIHRVQGLEPGLYHYRVQDHALELLRTADLTGEIVRHGLAQGFLGEANLVLVLTAIFQRLRWKYQERTYRYALLEAGHLGQNVYLAATSMGMGACAVGAFLDEELNGMLGIDGRGEAAIYLLAIGKL
jgi:SagB-type dehydrogenase family enzyme